MFEIKKLKGSTFYFEAFSNVGIYAPDGKNALLIDSCDHPRMVKALDRQLGEMNLGVSAVINTHGHVDHICGNSFFKDKYGCPLLSAEKEQAFIKYPSLESEFYYAGVDVKKTNNPYFLTEGSVTDILDRKNPPMEVEIIDLPGHSFEMVGVITGDNVFFMADSIVSEKTWDEYRLPFFNNINESIATLERIKEIKADIYVPAHAAPMEDVSELADYNIKMFKEKKKLTLSLCEGRSFDEIFEEYGKTEGFKIRADKYPMFAAVVRNLLQSLVEDGRIHAVYDNHRLIYELK